MDDGFLAADWGRIVERVGGSEALDRSARLHGALMRRRAVRDGAGLLRLCLAYSCGLSLREISGWAELTGGPAMSDVAVLKRLRGAAPWLDATVGALLAQRLPSSLAKRSIRLVDGSMVRGPGGALHRLHAAYDLGEQRFTHLALTDHRGAETLARAPVAAGEIRIGDRCYARPEGVRALCSDGGDVILRIGWKSLVLTSPEGAPIDLPALLDGLAPGAILDRPVAIRNGRKRTLPPIPARLIVIVKDANTAAQSRTRARRQSQRCGNVIQPATLKAADCLMLLTSLDPGEYAAADVAALYRLRWQIELAFKRLKSLLDFSRLPARDPQLARTWLLAKLLMALILEDLDRDLPDSPPCAG